MSSLAGEPSRTWTEEDRESLRLFWDLYLSVRDRVDKALAEHARKYPEFARLIAQIPAEEAARVAERNRVLQDRALRHGEWAPFEEDLELQGANYARLGIGFRRWFELVTAFRSLFVPHIVERYPDDHRAILSAGRGMALYVDTVMAAIGEGYLRAKEEIIRQQRAEIVELITPVLQLEDRLLVLPLVGTVDPTRAQQITDQLLRTVRDRHARAAVIDVTGVPGADLIVAQHLLKSVEAARLMGATVFVTGLSSETARSLVDIGVDITTLNTRGDLQSGVEAARNLLASDAARAPRVS
jgi:anti-anti-sigma regulatory factor